MLPTSRASTLVGRALRERDRYGVFRKHFFGQCVVDSLTQDTSFCSGPRFFPQVIADDATVNHSCLFTCRCEYWVMSGVGLLDGAAPDAVSDQLLTVRGPEVEFPEVCVACAIL